MKPAAEHPARLRAVPEPGEELADELEQRIDGYGVVLLADRCLAMSGPVDRIAVGPGGMTLIDTSSYSGPARIKDGRLIAAGEDHTAVVDRLLAQRREIEALLDAEDEGALQIKAALCWPQVEGAARFGSLTLKGVRVDGPRGVARLARRSGELPPDGVTLLSAMLDSALA
jgi:hypothetical protein